MPHLFRRESNPASPAAQSRPVPSSPVQARFGARKGSRRDRLVPTAASSRLLAATTTNDVTSPRGFHRHAEERSKVGSSERQNSTAPTSRRTSPPAPSLATLRHVLLVFSLPRLARGHRQADS
ncbi:hypothetical protein RJ55_04240 [Drechmeria coniospora]|nr:hypothetical protein RJ55_04240 [Drechmeria coniospora]